MTEHFLLYQNKKIYYSIFGEGKTVMLVHGFGEDGSIWESQAKFLSTHFRVIVPDIPGSGHSELIPNADIDTYAQVLKCIVDDTTAPDETISLIGHSMGGYIALAFAEFYGARLNKFGLFHSSSYADSEEKQANRKKAIAFIQENGAAAFLKTAIPGLFSEAFNKNHEAIVQKCIDKAKTFTVEALVQYYEAMIARSDREHILKNTNVPVFFIIGLLDQAVPSSQSLAQTYLPPVSYVHILPEVAHMGMLEATDLCNNYLSAFLLA
jgi:pimeloyl-ACP methyl ester carboxylesterase